MQLNVKKRHMLLWKQLKSVKLLEIKSTNEEELIAYPSIRKVDNLMENINEHQTSNTFMLQLVLIKQHGLKK